MQNFALEKNKYDFQLFKDLHTLDNNLDTCFEIFVLEKVKNIVELNGENIQINNRIVLFVSPLQKKKLNFDIKKTKGFHLIFRDSFFSNFFEDKLFAYRLHYFYNSQHPQFLQLSLEDFSFVKSVLDEVTDVLGTTQNNSKDTIKALLNTLLLKLNRLFSKEHALSSETQGNSAIYKFKEMLEHNVRKFHLVDDYCDILQIQRNKLNRIVKTHFGKTAKETIHCRLLQEIKLELLYSNKTVVQIANDLNFSEPNNMTRFFSRMEGIPPSVFRENK